ncbi:MAG: ATP-binding cassette domain-containing protein, partial [Pollutimonas bauzanensis]
MQDLTFDVGEREILGIIGPNGAGKTTAINLVSGVIQPSGGKVVFGGQTITGLPAYRLARKGLVRTFQSTTVYGERSVRENALRGAYLSLYPGFFNTVFNSAKARKMRARTEDIVDELLAWLSLTSVAHAAAG